MSSFADLVTAYLHHYPTEDVHVARVTAFLAQFQDPADLITRSNFTGHITASGFVLAPDRRSVLLVAHHGLGMFLQPGGHMDATDRSPRDGALREIHEETGLSGLTLVPTAGSLEIPFDIDSHYIPPNPRKQEPEHWHHDFRYLFVCEDETPLRLAMEEVGEAKWVPLEEIAQYPTFERVGMKLATVSLLPAASTL